MVPVGLVATVGNCTSRIFGLKRFFTDSVTDSVNSLNFEVVFHEDPERLNSTLSEGADCDNWGELSEDGGLGRLGLPEYIVV